MNGEAQAKITNSLALLVEGKDETQFFSALLKHLGINQVYILDVGGIANFATKFPAALLIPGFRENIKTYAIIRDADVNADSTFQSVKSLLQRHRQPVPAHHGDFALGPPKVGVYVMPGNAESGMLESLCLNTVAEHPIMTCVDSFMSCIGNQLQWRVPTSNAGDFPNNTHKAKAKCFLAGNVEDLPSVGVAAQAGVWKFDHESMRELREFLRDFAS